MVSPSSTRFVDNVRIFSDFFAKSPSRGGEGRGGATEILVCDKTKPCALLTNFRVRLVQHYVITHSFAFI